MVVLLIDDDNDDADADDDDVDVDDVIGAMQFVSRFCWC